MANAKLGNNNDIFSDINNVAGKSARDRDAEYKHVEEMLKKEYKLRDKYEAQIYAKLLKNARRIRDELGLEDKSWTDVAKENKKDKQAQRLAQEEFISRLKLIVNDPNIEKSKRDQAAKELKRLQVLEKVGDQFTSAFKAFGAYGDKLKELANQQLTHFSALNTRLQGSNKTYSSILNVVNRGVGLSAYITKSKVFEKLNDYVSQGIVYNVEQRAFLGTISDKIAATFDAANGTLLQLVRIQQADSTAARLGMESTLTKFLNGKFADTSYLNGLSDNVSAAILGANSQLSRDGSLAFEYQVQKWLGSMSSVGVSDSTIQSIAQGINALGTGDVNSLSNNTALQNLLVMAANTAGLDYSSLLSGGMNANITNKLMNGLVQYMQSVAGTSNQVVKSQYANLFGMTISDLTSLLNLSSKDLASISKNMLTYSNAISETKKGLSTLEQRTSAAELATNILDNIMYAGASAVSSTKVDYFTYLASQMVGDTVNALLGETKISPLGVGISFKSGDLIKGGVAAAYTSAGLLSGFGGHGFGSPSLDSWEAKEINQGRGRGLLSTFADSNVGRTVSETVYIGNNDNSALYKSTIMAADEQVNEVNGTSRQASTTESVSKISDITADSIDPNVKAIRDILEMWDFTGLKIRMF